MRLKVEIIFNDHCKFNLSSYLLLFIECSNPEQSDISMDNNDEIARNPSLACTQSTQTDIRDLTEKPSKNDVFEEQGTTLPSHSQNETEV